MKIRTRIDDRQTNLRHNALKNITFYIYVKVYDYFSSYRVINYGNRLCFFLCQTIM